MKYMLMSKVLGDGREVDSETWIRCDRCAHVFQFGQRCNGEFQACHFCCGVDNVHLMPVYVIEEMP